MAKQGLGDKSISELRSMAKEAGIKSGKEWRKEDVIKALSRMKSAKTKKKETTKKASEKTASRKPIVKKARTEKTPAKKKKEKGVEKVEKKLVAVKTAGTALKKPPLKSVAEKSAPRKMPVKKAAEKPVKKAAKKAAEKSAVTKIKKKPKPKTAVKHKAAVKVKAKTRVGGQRRDKASEKDFILEITKRGMSPAGIISITAEDMPGQDKVKQDAIKPLMIEYDRDKIVSMPVTPKRLYLYWEISEDTLSVHKGSLNIKVMDLKTDTFFYMPISERIGEHFINVSPEGEYAIEIGVIDDKGEFINITRFQPSEVSQGGESEAGEKEDTSEGEPLPESFFEIQESVSSY